MNWQSASDFWAMGGYGLYVWGSYAAVAFCMLLEPVLAARRHQRALQNATEHDPMSHTPRSPE
jgi:heme exporter protein D